MSSNHTVRLLLNGLLSLEYTPPDLLLLAQQNATTRLLSLPAELRAHIYSYVLSNNTVDLASRIVWDDNGTSQPSANAFALVCTCRQIYAEASQLIFSGNTFIVSTTTFIGKPSIVLVSDSLMKWKRGRERVRLVPGQARAIRTVKIDSLELAHQLYFRRWGARMTQKFVNLERIILSREYTMDQKMPRAAARKKVSVVELIRTIERKNVDVVLE